MRKRDLKKYIELLEADKARALHRGDVLERKFSRLSEHWKLSRETYEKNLKHNKERSEGLIVRNETLHELHESIQSIKKEVLDQQTNQLDHFIKKFMKRYTNALTEEPF